MMDSDQSQTVRGGEGPTARGTRHGLGIVT